MTEIKHGSREQNLWNNFLSLRGNAHPLEGGGEMGDSEGQTLLGGGSSSSSSSEELSSVRSMTSTFLLLSLDDRLGSCVSVLDESERKQEVDTNATQQRGPRTEKEPGIAHTAVYAVERSRHLLHLLLWPHGSPVSVFFELDFITVGTAVQDFHEQPGEKTNEPFQRMKGLKTVMSTPSLQIYKSLPYPSIKRCSYGAFLSQTGQTQVGFFSFIWI